MSNSDSENVDALRLIDQSSEPIKHINGFLKHHRIPTTRNAGDQKFVVDLTFEEIDNDLQATFPFTSTSLRTEKKRNSGTRPR